MPHGWRSCGPCLSALEAQVRRTRAVSIVDGSRQHIRRQNDVAAHAVACEELRVLKTLPGQTRVVLKRFLRLVGGLASG